MYTLDYLDGVGHFHVGFVRQGKKKKKTSRVW